MVVSVYVCVCLCVCVCVFLLFCFVCLVVVEGSYPPSKMIVPPGAVDNPKWL